MFVTAGRATAASVSPPNTPPSAQSEIFFEHYARGEQRVSSAEPSRAMLPA